MVTVEKIRPHRTVVCLVGSVDQEFEWHEYDQMLTKRGFVVFGAGSYDKTATPETWNIVTEVHQAKIMLSHIVAIIKKPNGTVGKHTQADIDFATQHGIKTIDVDELISQIDSRVGAKSNE